MIKSEPNNVTVAQSDDNLRLEVFLAQHFEGLSRHKAIELIRDGSVFVDGRKAKKGFRVSVGQTVEIRNLQFGNLQTNRKLTTQSDPMVLFENQELIIVNKPAGMPCHPLRFGERNTLLQWVGERFPEVLTAGSKPRHVALERLAAREGGLLHRLDIDTSGCVAFARTPKAFERWAPKFLGGGVQKTYIAIVSDCGPNCRPSCGPDGGDRLVIGENKTIDISLARSSSDAGRMVAMEWGDEKKRGPILEAKTEIRTLALGKGCALVEATIERGRMHQIRVHLAAIGHPIVGDKLYNPDCGPSGGPNRGPDCGAKRQMLHAWKLRLDQKTEVVAPMPEDMKALCTKCHIQL